MTRNILLATLFTLGTAIALLVIFLGEKSVRLPAATAAVVGVQLERGARDYEQYCAQCHGLAGQGQANETGAPQINNIVQRKVALQDANAPKSSEFERQYGIKEKYGTIRNYIVATLISGIRGTAMPAWGQEAGGPLRRDQIENITSYVLSWNGEVPEAAVDLAVQEADQRRTAFALANPPTTPFNAGEAIFNAKACAGCHLMTDKTLVGPGLGGLFDPEGTAAYGTLLPNGRAVDEPNVLEWIRGGTAGFPEKHVGLNPQADKADLLANAQMPAIALTDEEYQTMLVYLRAFNRDGSIKPGADAGEAATPQPGTLQATPKTTPEPAASASAGEPANGGAAQPASSATAAPGSQSTSGPVSGPTGP